MTILGHIQACPTRFLVQKTFVIYHIEKKVAKKKAFLGQASLVTLHVTKTPWSGLKYPATLHDCATARLCHFRLSNLDAIQYAKRQPEEAHGSAAEATSRELLGRGRRPRSAREIVIGRCTRKMLGGAHDVPVGEASAAPGQWKHGASSAPRRRAPALTMEIKTESPARAPQLPRTLPLVAASGGHAAAFSAERFSQLPLNGYLQRQLVKLELQAMTPVQQHAIPMLLSSRDSLVRSPTGSGKTLVYAVPAVQLLLNPAATGQTGSSRLTNTYVMVLLPTRELTVQTHEQLEALCRPFPTIVSSALMGGENRKAEKARLRKGVSIVVGTPGRISDHLQHTVSFNVSQCRMLVLDEADMLLQLGFKQVNMPNPAPRRISTRSTSPPLPC